MLEQLSIHNWILSHQIKTESGEPVDFHTHRYLFDIYRDNSPLLCCTKAGQIGFSTMAILKTIWLAYTKQMRVGYVLPTESMAQKFVSSKVNPIIIENAVISGYMSNKDAVEQKQVGKGFIHYVGAQTPHNAIMLTMDMLVGDEYDKAPQGIMEMFESRLQHSKYKWQWVFSNPTIPNFGVDRYWEKSDKKVWHIKHSCGEIYPLDEKCIDYKDEIYRCPSCHQEITDEERRMGEWIATAQGKWSGYWIPLWLSPDVSAADIADKKRRNTPEYFANFVAGLPYINTSNMLSQQILEQNLVDAVHSQEGRIIIGVDTGHDIYYTLANKDGIFHYGYCEKVKDNPIPGYDPYDELDKLMQTYPRSIMIADQGGDLIGIRKFQAKYPGRVFLCWFVKEKRSQQIITWKDNEERGRVDVDRNRMIEMVVEQIKEQRIPFWGTREEWQDWFDHALNIYRVKDEQGEPDDPQYGWRWVWKRKGPDHWFMSGVYALVGVDRFSLDLAQIIHKKQPFAAKSYKGDIVHSNNIDNQIWSQ